MIFLTSWKVSGTAVPTESTTKITYLSLKKAKLVVIKTTFRCISVSSVIVVVTIVIVISDRSHYMRLLPGLNLWTLKPWTRWAVFTNDQKSIDWMKLIVIHMHDGCEQIRRRDTLINNDATLFTPHLRSVYVCLRFNYALLYNHPTTHLFPFFFFSYWNVGGGSKFTAAAGGAENFSEDEDDRKQVSVSPQKMANKNLVRLQGYSHETTVLQTADGAFAAILCNYARKTKLFLSDVLIFGQVFLILAT